MNAMTGDEIQAKCLSEGDFGSYLVLFEGHTRLRGFLEIMHLIPDKEYWPLLAMVWEHSDCTFQYRRHWIRLFSSRRPFRAMLMEKEGHEVLSGLPDRFTVYRGITHEKGKNGLSWTLDEAKAKWFTTYSNSGRLQLHHGIPVGKPMLVSGIAHKKDVFAYFNGRKEQEIVIKASCVRSKTMREI